MIFGPWLSTLFSMSSFTLAHEMSLYSSFTSLVQIHSSSKVSPMYTVPRLGLMYRPEFRPSHNMNKIKFNHWKILIGVILINTYYLIWVFVLQEFNAYFTWVQSRSVSIYYNGLQYVAYSIVLSWWIKYFINNCYIILYSHKNRVCNKSINLACDLLTRHMCHVYGDFFFIIKKAKCRLYMYI